MWSFLQSSQKCLTSPTLLNSVFERLPEIRPSGPWAKVSHSKASSPVHDVRAVRVEPKRLVEVSLNWLVKCGIPVRIVIIPNQLDSI
jgi:hypothetical protein